MIVISPSPVIPAVQKGPRQAAAVINSTSTTRADDNHAPLASSPKRKVTPASPGQKGSRLVFCAAPFNASCLRRSFELISQRSPQADTCLTRSTAPDTQHYRLRRDYQVCPAANVVNQCCPPLVFSIRIFTAIRNSVPRSSFSTQFGVDRLVACSRPFVPDNASPYRGTCCQVSSFQPMKFDIPRASSHEEVVSDQFHCNILTAPAEPPPRLTCVHSPPRDQRLRSLSQPADQRGSIIERHDRPACLMRLRNISRQRVLSVSNTTRSHARWLPDNDFQPSSVKYLLARFACVTRRRVHSEP